MPSRYTFPLTVDTIGKMSTGDYLIAICRNDACRHEGQLDLMALVRERGPDYPIAALQKAAYCRPCREAGRPDRKLRWNHGTDGRQNTEFLGDVYDRERAATVHATEPRTEGTSIADQPSAASPAP